MESIRAKDFENTGLIFQIGVVPGRINIINYIDGLTFEEAEEDKITIELEGLKIPIISKQKLIINKRATGREKDKLDTDSLSKL